MPKEKEENRQLADRFADGTFDRANARKRDEAKRIKRALRRVAESVIKRALRNSRKHNQPHITA